ncbi:MAG TPA: ABC transporter substrate-binding protein [Candidatus Binatia bacterium]|nr:ABC transporter substrate-binding protein [Candidatus Binatia bacterium]
MQSKKLWNSIVGIGVFLVTSSVAAQEGLKKIRIAYPSNTICCLPLFGALQWKVFEANGLHAEIIQVRSQVAYPALSSGEVQYVAGVGPASVSATLRGMPSRAVWFATEELIYSLMVRPDIHNVRDLRNKKIALTGIGGTSHVSLQIALEAIGENPKNFIYLGMGGTQLLPALESGTVEGALLSPPMLYFAKKKGFRELIDVGSRAKMPLGGLTVMLSTLRNRPDELKKVIRSMQSAKQEILKSREKSVALISSFLQVDRDVAEDTYAVYRKTVSGNGVPTHEGMDQIIKSLQAAGQFTDKKVAFEDIADDRIAKDVARELGYKVQ